MTHPLASCVEKKSGRLDGGVDDLVDAIVKSEAGRLLEVIFDLKDEQHV